MIAPVGESCGPDCSAFVEKWSAWLAVHGRRPLALLDCSVPYLELVEPKTRNMVRKADRLYAYRPFEYNDHLAEIDAINSSKAMRQGRPMSGWYTEPAQPSRPAQMCAVHTDIWHGGFGRESDTLLAFARVARVSDELAILVSFLGHAQASAVMNGMVAYLAGRHDSHWLDYLHMSSASKSLEEFKRRLGFAEHWVSEL